MTDFWWATADTDEPRVPKRNACTVCGEDRIDWLTWTEDEKVRCGTCGHEYVPKERER